MWAEMFMFMFYRVFEDGRVKEIKLLQKSCETLLVVCAVFPLASNQFRQSFIQNVTLQYASGGTHYNNGATLQSGSPSFVAGANLAMHFHMQGDTESKLVPTTPSSKDELQGMSHHNILQNLSAYRSSIIDVDAFFSNNKEMIYSCQFEELKITAATK